MAVSIDAENIFVFMDFRPSGDNIHPTPSRVARLSRVFVEAVYNTLPLMGKDVGFHTIGGGRLQLVDFLRNDAI
jgi:hypothetical protein